MLRFGRRIRKFSSTAATPSPVVKSAFELDDAPLFSLRTRIIFFSLLGGAAIFSSASYWLTSDRENAYLAYDKFPWLMQQFGARLGVPMDAEGRINRLLLGPRDVRDLVGEEKIAIRIRLENGDSLVTEAYPQDSMEEVLRVCATPLQTVKSIGVVD